MSFHYSFDGAEFTTTPAHADGTAAVDWTPDTSGYHSLQAHTTDATGTESPMRCWAPTARDPDWFRAG